MKKENSHAKSTRKKRFNLLLTDEELEFLKKIATEENRSIAEILRNAVDYLYKPKSNIERIAFFQKLEDQNYLNDFNFQNYLFNIRNYE